MKQDRPGPAGARPEISGRSADFVLLARLGAVLTALLSAAYLYFFARR